MIDNIDHDLIGYLLGALEADEREQVAAALAADAALRERLESLRSELRLLEDPPTFEPPADLAERTCAFIAAHAEPPSPAGDVSRKAGRLKTHESLAPSRGWRSVDIAVSIAVCIAGAALIFPLINSSRANSQIAICANKLREIGLALTGFSERHNGLFPQVPETGNLAAAGVYAPTLIDSRFISDPRVVICPGSPLAEQPGFRIPRLDEIQEARAEQLAELRRKMGGSYGYVLGYRDNGVYKPTRNLYREKFAIASDAPSDDLDNSPNHGRNGYNALLEDGHVVYLRLCRLDGTGDDIFRNDMGELAPGCQVNDAVVARSDVSP